MPSTPAAGSVAVSPWRGLVLVCLAGVIWGTIGPAVDVVADRSALPVLTISAYRALVAVVVLVLAVVVTGRVARCRALLREEPLRVGLVGVLTASFQMLFFIAVVSIGVSVTTVVCLGFAPAFLLVLTTLRQRARPARAELLTVATAVLGLVLVASAGGEQSVSHPVVGVVTALAAGAAYALSAEVGAPLSHRHDAVSVATTTMSVAGAVLVVVGLPLAALRGESMVTNDTSSWLLIGYLGVVTMALAYVLLFAGLRTTRSGAVVVATLLEPVTAVAIAVTVLGETLGLEGILGSVLILVAIGTLGRRRPEAAAPQ